MNRKLDTDTQVFFYEQEFYVLSNFSAFEVMRAGIKFKTAEHAYHYTKFLPAPSSDVGLDQIKKLDAIRIEIRYATSAHMAFQLARENAVNVRHDWEKIRVLVMREILRLKVVQHEYVKRKLLETGDRELIEDSWRDDFWGWGPNRDGKNTLGKLWMEIRTELKELLP